MDCAEDLPKVAEDVRSRGVADSEKIINAFLETYARWEKIIAEAGRDPETVARLMREKIISVAPTGL